MKKRILQFTDKEDLKILTTAWETVKEITPEIKELVQDLFDTCDAAWIWVWMSANQIWVAKRVFVIAYQSFRKAFINPSIINESWEIIRDWETCLSYADWRSTETRRLSRIRVSFTNLEWESEEMSLKNFKAVIFQHEMDHMNWEII